jgi:chemotaxis protein methyltransferase WspC
MLIAEFEQLLQQTMGLDAASIGSSTIERAVQRRLSACGLEDPYAYWERARTSPIELQELIEAVVVSESWFIRDIEAFAAMTRLAYQEWMQDHSEGVLRLLSLPCSTGEEPYSMAIALLDAGFPPNLFRIDAVDISGRALQRAQHAVYGRNSFRGDDLGFRDRHFEHVPHRYRLSETVRRHVHFERGTLIDAGLLAGTAVYDIIFCRNLLICFDRPTQHHALDVLTRLLTAKGLLFVGPSESGLLLSHGFDSAKVPLAFAFRKAGALAAEIKRHAIHPISPAAPARAIPFALRPALDRRSVPRHRPIAAQRPVPTVTLEPRPPAEASASTDEAQRLADQGRLVEAARCCEEVLRSQGPSAPAYYLLGLVHDATDNRRQACEFYRKALYLDPIHHEALVNLAVLLEQQGDAAGAEVLSERARRLEQEAKS